MAREGRSRVWIVVLVASALPALGLLGVPSSWVGDGADGYSCRGSSLSTLMHPQAEMRPNSGFFDEGRQCNHDARVVGGVALGAAVLGVIGAAACFRWVKVPIPPPKRSISA